MKYEQDFLSGFMEKAGMFDVPPFFPSIPVGQAIDTISRDPFITPGAKYSLNKVLTEANNGSDRGLIGWGDVARTAIGYGLGRVGGSILGKTLGFITGHISPDGQKRIAQMGGVAGALGGAGVIKGW